MRANIYCLVTRCCGLLLAFGWIVPAAGQPSASERAVVLTEGQHWRKFFVFSRPGYEGENLPAVPQADPPFRDSVYDLFSKPPPSDWTKPDFDDSLWLLCCGREFTSGIKDARLQQGLDLSSPNAALRGTDPFFVPVGVVYLRGRFWVNDRTKVHRAAFVLAYRGGFVAHLNGVEVARSHLPEGALSHNTAATVYPA
ncbi:MAG: hypothetical protein N2255_08695, partial [Kiritimatiellae bacterium]|nr:hypothetical protein [Kiritimatiellia bacterium]